MSLTLGSADREVALRAYLLGSLPADQQEPIDEQVVTDPEAHEELLAAQDDLIHEYLKGALPAAERERFESHFLASPRRRERVAFVRSLLTAVERSQAPATRVSGAPPPRRWNTVLPWAAAVAIGLAGGAWSIGERRRADREIAGAAARERALGGTIVEQRQQIDTLKTQVAGAAAADVTTWPLSAGTLRGPREPVAHEAIRAGWIRLRAPISHEYRAASLVASLQTPEGRELARVPALRAVDGPKGPVVDVIVPAGLVPRGTYVLSILSDRSPGQELAVATFSVR